MRHLLAILLMTAPCVAVEPLVVAGGDLPPEALGHHLEVLTDPTGKLGLDEVLQAERAASWRPVGEVTPAFGFTKDTVWLRLSVQSMATATVPVVIDLATARPSHIRWHVLDAGRLVSSFDAGGADNPTTKGRLSRFPVLRLELPPGGERTVVLRASSDTSLWLPLTASGPEAYDRLDDDRVARDLMQVGFCVSLAFLALLLRFAHRQPMYGHIIYLALAYAGYIAGFNGHLGRLWPDMPHWVEREGMMAATTLGIFIFTHFNGEYLRRETLTPRERLLQRGAEIVMLAAALAFLVLDYRTAASALNPMLLLGIGASLLVVLSRLRRRRDSVEMAFVAAWGLYGASIVWLGMIFLNLAPIQADVAAIQALMLPAVLCAFFVAVATRQRSAQDAELLVIQAREATSRARLEALRYQINPHFLFNTLTSVDALARTEPSKVPGLVSRLATFLRLRLQPSEDALIRLEQEIEATRAYLDIERVRFGEDLEVGILAEAGTSEWKVPELILQPLVENAVKHGMREGGRMRLEVRARRSGGKLQVEVANTGTLAVSEGGGRAGLGLENVRQRLRLTYGEGASLVLSQESGWVVARLVLPEHPLVP